MPGKVTLKGQNESATTPYRFDINLFELARIIFEKRRLIIGASIAVMVITAAYLFLQPNLYTSKATILPSGKTNSLSAIKSLVGLGDPIANPDENSSALYPVILKSNLVVDALLKESYSFNHESQPMQLTLKEYLGINNRDRLRSAVRDITTVRSDNQTGEIYVGVETSYPALSQAILRHYLNQLEDFNRNKRRSSARNNEKYLSGQLEIIQQELRVAEDSLEAFQLANLDWAGSGSPEILKEIGRFRRAVESKSATYTLLMQEYEMAKLEAQKDIPIIRILDLPSLPTTKSGPFRRNIILLSGVLSFILIAFGLLVGHLITQATTGSDHDDYDALRCDFHMAFPRTIKTLNRIKSTVLEKTTLIKG